MKLNYLEEAMAEGPKPFIIYTWSTQWGDITLKGTSTLNATARASDRGEISKEQYEWLRSNPHHTETPTGESGYGF